MGKLITAPNIARADEVYERLIDLHAGRSEAESMRINAKLILVLINHIGDEPTIYEAMAIAGEPGVEGRP
jgi:hypothetical protein